MNEIDFQRLWRNLIINLKFDKFRFLLKTLVLNNFNVSKSVSVPREKKQFFETRENKELFTKFPKEQALVII